MKKKPKNRDYLKSRQLLKMFQKEKKQVTPDFENMEQIQIGPKTWVLKPKAKPDGQ